MNVTDRLYTEWAWRSKTGTPSMDNAEDKAILDKLIAEYSPKPFTYNLQGTSNTADILSEIYNEL